MALSTDLIMQFVKATKSNDESKKETTVYGTIVENGDNLYVRLDGATNENLIPLNTTIDVTDGNRVTVLIKNHTAVVTGNLTNPSARTVYVDDKVGDFDTIHTENLKAEIARIDKLTADNVNINDKLTAYKADIDTLSTSKLDAYEASVTYATIDTLTATDAKVASLEASYGEFEILTTERLDAVEANITSLDTSYANIDFSNIGKAAMEYFYAQSGLIDNVVVGDQTITGELVGVTINGDRLIGNTIIAEKLVIKGSDGLYYKLNTDGMTVEAEQTDENSLNGQIIKAKSITATKIAVDDLVAFDATIGGFNITESAIYSGVKESVENTTQGVYLDKSGQMSVGDTSRYIKYYKDTDGSYRLAISADSITFSSGSDLVNEITSNVKIGGRNLYTGTGDFSGTWSNRGSWNIDGTDQNGNIILRKDGAWSGLSQYVQARQGETYILSANVRGNGTATTVFYINEVVADDPDSDMGGRATQVGGWGILAPTVETRIHSIPYTVTKDCTIRFRIENAVDNASLWVSSIKLERGTIPTDWTPAPEDSFTDNTSKFMEFNSENGLQVGNKLSGMWEGFRAQITGSAFNVLSAAGSTVATYGEKLIELGKNATDAVIKLCGGKGQIEYTTDSDTGDAYLQISADKLRLKSSEMSSLYSMYTDNSTRWEKSATNVSPTKVGIYASKCIDPTMVDKVEGWSTSSVDVNTTGVDVNTPGDINLKGSAVRDAYGQFESVVRGDSGIWTYRKWLNGDVDLVASYTVYNLDCKTALGNMFRTDVFTPNPFPFTVYDPKVTANYESDGYGAFLWATTTTTTAKPSNYYLVRPTSTTIANGKIVFHVRGRWKI